MNATKKKNTILTTSRKSAVGARRQVGALPYRIVDGAPVFLLVTSRETRRWVIPKGWPMRGRKNEQAAAIEAYEEAGVRGETARAVGSYPYWKRRDEGFVLCAVEVFPLSVTEILDDWPERTERERVWFSLEDAWDAVDEPGLQAILCAFAAGLGTRLLTPCRSAIDRSVRRT